MIGVVGWALIAAAALAWEWIGLRARGDEWPTVSDLVRWAMRSPVGRWVLFALWLWLGWHLFVRGWEFFLRDLPDAAAAASGEGAPSSRAAVVARVVATSAGGYVSFVALTGLYHVVNEEPASFFAEALGGGAFLAFVVALPSFALLSGASWLRRRARRK